jgi:hypothetical protein
MTNPLKVQLCPLEAHPVAATMHAFPCVANCNERNDLVYRRPQEHHQRDHYCSDFKVRGRNIQLRKRAKHVKDKSISRGEKVFNNLSSAERTLFWVTFGHFITVSARFVNRPDAMAAFNEMLHGIISQIMLRVSGQEGCMTDAQWFDRVMSDAPQGWRPQTWIEAALQTTHYATTTGSGTNNTVPVQTPSTEDARGRRPKQ